MKVIQKPQTQKQPQRKNGNPLSDRINCSRCGGMLILTFCISPDQSTWDFEIPVGKCLQCGDMIDPTILKHRTQSHSVHSIN